MFKPALADGGFKGLAQGADLVVERGPSGRLAAVDAVVGEYGRT